MNTTMQVIATRVQAEAAIELLTCLKLLAESGASIISEVLGGNEFIQWEHYPQNDAFDAATRSQYYFHAHPPEGRETPDYGHFHTFLRRPIMSNETCRAASFQQQEIDCGEGIYHLVGISLNGDGVPWRLFTTNKWVTGETWCSASQTIAMLGEFAPATNDPSSAVSRWVTAMVRLFRPQIELIIHQRDEAVARWQAAHPDADAFEDRALEITSAIEISLHDQVSWIDETFEE